MGRINLFWDSGAHSIYAKSLAGGKSTAQKEKVDYSYVKTQEFKQYMDDYIKFIHENNDGKAIKTFVSLDVIFNPELSWEMHQIMKSNGCDVVPVFHYGEDIKWLKKYMDTEEYLGVGALGQIVSKENYVQGMGREVFDVLTDKNGYMTRKVHGFACNSTEVLRRYPWTTVDSNTSVRFAAYGSIFTPKKNHDGSYDFSDYKPVFVTKRSKFLNFENNLNEKHIENLPDADREFVLNYIDYFGQKFGVSEYIKVPKGYTLQELKIDDETGERHLELWSNMEKTEICRPLVYGVSNSIKERSLFNIKFMQKTAIANTVDKYERVQRGFFV